MSTTTNATPEPGADRQWSRETRPDDVDYGRPAHSWDETYADPFTVYAERDEPVYREEPDELQYPYDTPASVAWENPKLY